MFMELFSAKTECFEGLYNAQNPDRNNADPSKQIATQKEALFRLEIY